MMDKRRGGFRKKKVCQFCSDEHKAIDYKDVETLKKHITERGKILPSYRNLCSSPKGDHKSDQESQNRGTVAIPG